MRNRIAALVLTLGLGLAMPALSGAASMWNENTDDQQDGHVHRPGLRALGNVDLTPATRTWTITP